MATWGTLLEQLMSGLKHSAEQIINVRLLRIEVYRGDAPLNVETDPFEPRDGFESRSQAGEILCGEVLN